MKKTCLLLWAIYACLISSAQTKVYQFEGGSWFNGKDFTPATFYSVNGILTGRKPAKIDSVIHVHHKYVIPPFGDAHHHGIDGPTDLDKKINSFLKQGVFYIKNPNVIPQLLNEVHNRINQPQSIDVSFSNGGLTGSGGHPVVLHKQLAAQGVFANITVDDLEGKAYYIIDSRIDLDNKWQQILDSKPGFIKIFLLHAGEYEKRKDDVVYEGYRGLDPALVPVIVDKAHASGLEVTAHVETAEDFMLAAMAGVDEINHIPLPGSLSVRDFEAATISKKAAIIAAKNKTRVVGTLCWVLYSGIADSIQLQRLHSLNRKNVQTLFLSGVKLAIGSDGISGEEPIRTGLTEALYWHNEGLLDNLSLLKAWTEHTAQTIFPGRKIGFLQEGYEASFLVLDGNPLKDFNYVKKIFLRIKQGQIINSAY